MYFQIYSLKQSNPNFAIFLKIDYNAWKVEYQDFIGRDYLYYSKKIEHI
jgi:hypothetical protein